MNNLHNINIERAVLSSFFFNPNIFLLNLHKLSADDFYLPAHRYIYETMVELEKAEKPIDEEFIAMELQKQNRWDENAMLEITSTNPLPNLDGYIEELRDKSQRRETVEMMSEVKNKLGASEEVYDILGFMSKTINEIADKSISKKSKNIKKIVDEFEKEFKEAREYKDYVGYKSGIGSLDNIVGAFSPGDLVVVAARPSMGKTSFATTITNYADKNGDGVLFDSLEMSDTQIIRRLHAQRADESLSDIKRGLMKNPARFAKSLKELRYSKNIIIHDESYISIHQLVAKASIVFRKNPHVKYWIIDHLRYIKKDGKNIPQEVSEITKLIKKTAKEYGVAVFLLSQLNRANETQQNKRPLLSNIRESGAVEEDAEIVLALHRESYYNRNDPSIPEQPINPAEIIVLKNRDGRSGCARCFFDGPHTCFTDVPVQVYEYEGKVLNMGGVI
ncbi:MAG: hypothetical protein GXP61_08130 [Epsilonproteobacteria bacterium]|nr:hypothetical protein [Campylobacterota bacterium]